MERKQQVYRAFKSLLRDHPYERITVSEICRKAGLSRKVFYGSFHDKEAIVEDLFYLHAVDSTRQLNRVFDLRDLDRMGDMVRNRIYEGLYAERGYYVDLARTVGAYSPVFVSVATRVLERWNQELFPQMGCFPSSQVQDYACYYYAAAQAMLLQRWINDGMEMPPRELGALYHEMSGDYLRKLAAAQLSL